MVNITDTQTTIPHASERGGSTTPEGTTPGTCCGGPAPTGTDACCVQDAEVKSSGGTGCGCGSGPAAPAPRKTACCG